MSEGESQTRRHEKWWRIGFRIAASQIVDGISDISIAVAWGLATGDPAFVNSVVRTILTMGALKFPYYYLCDEGIDHIQAGRDKTGDPNKKAYEKPLRSLLAVGLPRLPGLFLNTGILTYFAHGDIGRTGPFGVATLFTSALIFYAVRRTLTHFNWGIVEKSVTEPSKKSIVVRRGLDMAQHCIQRPIRIIRRPSFAALMKRARR